MIFILLFTPFLFKKKEGFSDNENEIIYTYTSIERIYLYLFGFNPDFYYKWNLVDKILVAILYMITFIISAIAAYLSYNCTWKGSIKNVFYRFLFSIVAFLLGPLYILWYFFVNYIGGLC
jgi:hypothetical protein